MKLVLKISFIIFVFTLLAFITPVSAFANSQTNPFPFHFPFRGFFLSLWQRCQGDENPFCQQFPYHASCHPPVPEFGFIPGVIATVTSAGTFFFLKKRSK